MSTDGIDKDTQKFIDEVRAQFEVVKKLPEPDRSRGILCLAYEFFNLDMEEEAFKYIGQADPNYFQGQMAQDAKNIEDFDKIVVSIMAKLLHLGYITDPKAKGKKKK